MYVFTNLELPNEGTVTVSMKGRHKLSKILPINRVALNSGYTGMLLILIVQDHQLGASLHTAYPVADSEGVIASMLHLHRHKHQ